MWQCEIPWCTMYHVWCMVTYHGWCTMVMYHVWCTMVYHVSCIVYHVSCMVYDGVPCIMYGVRWWCIMYGVRWYMLWRQTTFWYSKWSFLSAKDIVFCNSEAYASELQKNLKEMLSDNCQKSICQCYDTVSIIKYKNGNFMLSKWYEVSYIDNEARNC